MEKLYSILLKILYIKIKYFILEINLYYKLI
nr:MAG TPA: hypothetical protein [Crassvirales sp.]